MLPSRKWKAVVVIIGNVNHVALMDLRNHVLGINKCLIHNESY